MSSTIVSYLYCIVGDKETASAAEEGQNGNLANADIHDALQPRGPPSPLSSCQYPVEQQPTDTADLEILQLPDQRPNYLVSMHSTIDS